MSGSMTELESIGNLEDKQRIYDEAKISSLRAADRVTKLERLLEVERRHAAKMADRQNKALRELKEASQ